MLCGKHTRKEDFQALRCPLRPACQDVYCLKLCDVLFSQHVRRCEDVVFNQIVLIMLGVGIVLGMSRTSSLCCRSTFIFGRLCRCVDHVDVVDVFRAVVGTKEFMHCRWCSLAGELFIVLAVVVNMHMCLYDFC